MLNKDVMTGYEAPMLSTRLMAYMSVSDNYGLFAGMFLFK
jgi:hypothetical protein